ncbi:MAG TPA: alkaline phosphatase family protein, partial [Streptosporangiaceae bacterium]|nr:alkaline phosphatase family protein [Streptosporangiaceae bacterium]
MASALVLVGALTIAIAAQANNQVQRRDPALAATSGIHKIKHVIVIMQENRSFDSYFGTFPGADGIPAGVCLHDPRNGGCRRP